MNCPRSWRRDVIENPKENYEKHKEQPNGLPVHSNSWWNHDHHKFTTKLSYLRLVSWGHWWETGHDPQTKRRRETGKRRKTTKQLQKVSINPFQTLWTWYLAGKKRPMINFFRVLCSSTKVGLVLDVKLTLCSMFAIINKHTGLPLLALLHCFITLAFLCYCDAFLRRCLSNGGIKFSKTASCCWDEFGKDGNPRWRWRRQFSNRSKITRLSVVILQ